MSTLNKSIVEDAALEWFGELGYAVRHGPHLAPGEPAAERDSFSEVLLVGCLREALRRLNPAISEDAWAVVSILESAADSYGKKVA
jgi:type I restriction enzyme R subunit